MSEGIPLSKLNWGGVESPEVDYWRTSGDAEWQLAVNDWATQRYGADWHDKYVPWEIEALYKLTLDIL